MLRLKNSLIAFAGLSALIGLITLVTPTKSVGQGGKLPQPQDVRLVGTSVTQPVSASSPLPVEGSVVVANTPSVQAQQSGAWNVGFSGTPSVNVANTLTVGLDSSANTVKIDTTSPLSARDADNPARNAFVYTDGGLFEEGEPEAGFRIFVPAHKLLVIEQVSIAANLVPGIDQRLWATVFTQTNTQDFCSGLAGTLLGPSAPFDLFVASSQVKCYADRNVSIKIGRNSALGPQGSWTASLYGYLVDR